MKLTLRHAIPTALALAAIAPAAADASPRQVVAFEAPRELLSWGERERTLDEIQDFGVKQVRQLVYWEEFAPRPNGKRKPRGFDGADPDDYPAGTWDRLDALIRDADVRGIDVHINLTGPVPRWATGTKKGHLNRPNPREFRAWATAVGRRYGDAGLDLVDLERAEPPALPQAAVPQGPPGFARHLPRALPRGRPRPEAHAGQPRRHLPARRDRAAGQLRGRLPARLLPADALPEGELQAREEVRAARRRRLRPPRLHDGQGPAVRPARHRRRHDRRAVAPHPRARPRGRGRRAPARAPDLPHGVRHPVAAGPHPGRDVPQAGGLHGDRGAHGLRQPARALVLAVPDEGRQAAPVAVQPLRGLRERPAHQARPQEAGLPRVPAAARGRELRALGRPLGPGAAAARASRRWSSRWTGRAARPAGASCAS